MQSENPLLDQIAKLVTNAAGAAKGVRDEIGAMVKSQAERLVNDLDLVPREEFEAIKSFAAISRTQVEQLQARLATRVCNFVACEKNDSQHAKQAYPQTIPKHEISPVTQST